jgi:hypothetical protein
MTVDGKTGYSGFPPISAGVSSDGGLPRVPTTQPWLSSMLVSRMAHADANAVGSDAPCICQRPVHPAWIQVRRVRLPHVLCSPHFVMRDPEGMRFFP